VAVMAESVPLENLRAGKISNQSLFFKMKVLEIHISVEIKSLIKDSTIAAT